MDKLIQTEICLSFPPQSYLRDRSLPEIIVKFLTIIDEIILLTCNKNLKEMLEASESYNCYRECREKMKHMDTESGKKVISNILSQENQIQLSHAQIASIISKGVKFAMKSPEGSLDLSGNKVGLLGVKTIAETITNNLRDKTAEQNKRIAEAIIISGL